MATDFIPSTDDALLAWATQFSTKISLTPTAYGLTAANATSLATLKTTYATNLAAALDPQTRGPSTVYAKDTARGELVAYCRQLARAIQGTLTVTNQQRVDLGLTVRDVEPSPIPPPAMKPAAVIEQVSGNTVRVRLIDPENPTRRGKPAGVSGAYVFSFVGDEPPTTEAGWKFEAGITRTTLDVTFPSTVAPGSKVWITAVWRNPRDLTGPAAIPVTTNIAGGAAMAA